MTTHEHHEELLKGFYKEFGWIFKNSEQAMYLYLDDAHKLCNKKFAAMLGYKSAQEWAKVSGSFIGAFVDEKSQHTLINAYRNAMEKVIGSAIDVTWKTKSSRKINSKVILVPVAHKGHLMALHFISSK